MLKRLLVLLALAAAAPAAAETVVVHAGRLIADASRPASGPATVTVVDGASRPLSAGGSMKRSWPLSRARLAAPSAEGDVDTAKQPVLARDEPTFETARESESPLRTNREATTDAALVGPPAPEADVRARMEALRRRAAAHRFHLLPPPGRRRASS